MSIPLETGRGGEGGTIREEKEKARPGGEREEAKKETGKVVLDASYQIPPSTDDLGSQIPDAVWREHFGLTHLNALSQ